MVSRRFLLKALLTTAAFYPLKGLYAYEGQERILKMYNIHTDERINTVYFSSGIYDPDAIDSINYFLRCHYTDKVMPIDIKVIDLLCKIKDFYGCKKEVTIISGYRSKRYNKYLRSLGRNVGKRSQHLKGKAIDFTIEGVSNGQLARLAKSFKAGGVGKYRDFVHIDTGRVRYW